MTHSPCSTGYCFSAVDIAWSQMMSSHRRRSGTVWGTPHISENFCAKCKSTYGSLGTCFHRIIPEAISGRWALPPIMNRVILPIVKKLQCHSVGFTIQKIFSSYNITASTTRQVLISDRTVGFSESSSESSSLHGKRACNILRKCPPTKKIEITCFLS